MWPFGSRHPNSSPAQIALSLPRVPRPQPTSVCSALSYSSRPHSDPASSRKPSLTSPAHMILSEGFWPHQKEPGHFSSVPTLSLGTNPVWVQAVFWVRAWFPLTGAGLAGSGPPWATKERTEGFSWYEMIPTAAKGCLRTPPWVLS